MTTRFDVIEERLQQAYAGPWHDDVTEDGELVVIDNRGMRFPVCWVGDMEGTTSKDHWTAQLIAHTPADLRFLLDEVYRLQAKLAASETDGGENA